MVAKRSVKSAILTVISRAKRTTGKAPAIGSIVPELAELRFLTLMSATELRAMTETEHRRLALSSYAKAEDWPQKAGKPCPKRGCWASDTEAERRSESNMVGHGSRVVIKTLRDAGVQVETVSFDETWAGLTSEERKAVGEHAASVALARRK